MITTKNMVTLRTMAELLNNLNPEGNDAIIFLAVSGESKSGTSLIKGTEPAIAAALSALITDALDGIPCESQKRIKSFLMRYVLEGK